MLPTDKMQYWNPVFGGQTPVYLDPEKDKPVDISKYNTQAAMKAMSIRHQNFILKLESDNPKRHLRFKEFIKETCRDFAFCTLMFQCNDCDMQLMRQASLDYVKNLSLEEAILLKTASIIFSDFSTEIVKTRHNYYVSHFTVPLDIRKNFGISFLSQAKIVEMFTINNNRNLWDFMVEHPHDVLPGFKESAVEACSSIIDGAIATFCINFFQFSDKIDESNYLTFKNDMTDPDHLTDIIEQSVLRMISYIYGLRVEIGDGSNNEAVIGLHKQLEQKDRELEESVSAQNEMSETIMALDTEIASLKAKNQALYQKSQEDQTEATRKINSLYKEIRRLQHSLPHETVDMSEPEVVEVSPVEAVLPDVVEENKPVSQQYVCDVNKRYLFVFGDQTSTALLNRIDAEFPNSSIYMARQNLNPKDVDAIIIMTSFIPHRLAYAYRSMGVSRNIPYMYCSKANIDQIKNDIAFQLKQTAN